MLRIIAIAGLVTLLGRTGATAQELFSEPQQKINGVGSAFGPSLAAFGNRLYAAWKGVSDDQGIYWSSFNGRSWAPQQKIDGVGSAKGPSLAAFGNRLYAAWRGTDGDQGIYWSSFDGQSWASQQKIDGVGSAIGPSLAAFGNRLYAAWRGTNDDQEIWWSSFDGKSWAPQQKINGVGSLTGPSLAVFGNRLYGAWRGPFYYKAGDDQEIYWSSGRPMGTEVAAVSPKPGGVSLFAVDGAGAVQSTYFDPRVSNQWAPWFQLSGASFPVGTAVAAVSPVPGGVSLFAVDGSGTVQSTYFDPRVSNRWAPWFPLAQP